MYKSNVENILSETLGTGNRKSVSEKFYDTVEIGGQTFTDYGEFSFFWEKTYVKQPSRSVSGAMSELDNIATFNVPHLKIKYSLMSITDYRRLGQLILLKNEFLVKCYDALNDKVTTNKMYFLPDQMPQFFSIAHYTASGDATWSELIGVKDYTIEMVGTLND